MERIVVLGGGESGFGSAVLAKQKGFIKSEDLCQQLDIRPRTLREDIRLYKEKIEKEI